MHRQYNSADQARPALNRILLTATLAAVGFAAAAAYYDPAAEPPLMAATIPAGIPMRDPQPGEFDALIRSAIDDALKVPSKVAASDWRSVNIRNGHSLSAIFDALDLPADDWVSLLKLGGEVDQLRHLHEGDALNLRIEGGRLMELTYALDEARTLDVRREANGAFKSVVLTSAIEHRDVETAGSIQDSLFVDGRRANLSDRLILQIADIFNYDIDFAQDLQPGDRFAVVYDVLYKNGKKLRDGDIVAAEFVNQGHAYKAVRYKDSEGHYAFYTPEGLSLKKAFIRTPVDFTRISSGFTLHRYHPILNTIRAHKGVDYAAPMGTPVKAAGDGRVEFVGRKGGYGNFILLKHYGAYETAYGHLSRFRPGLRPGQAVHMGEVIGYVGMTGLATGPHLHYEFRVNGVHVNPVTVKLPGGMPLQGRQEMARFRFDTAPLVARLDAAASQNRLASLAAPADPVSQD